MLIEGRGSHVGDGESGVVKVKREGIRLGEGG